MTRFICICLFLSVVSCKDSARDSKISALEGERLQQNIDCMAMIQNYEDLIRCEHRLNDFYKSQKTIVDMSWPAYQEVFAGIKGDIVKNGKNITLETKSGVKISMTEKGIIFQSESIDTENKDIKSQFLKNVFPHWRGLEQSLYHMSLMSNNDLRHDLIYNQYIIDIYKAGYINDKYKVFICIVKNNQI